MRLQDLIIPAIGAAIAGYSNKAATAVGTGARLFDLVSTWRMREQAAQEEAALRQAEAIRRQAEEQRLQELLTNASSAVESYVAANPALYPKNTAPLVASFLPLAGPSGVDDILSLLKAPVGNAPSVLPRSLAAAAEKMANLPENTLQTHADFNAAMRLVPKPDSDGPYVPVVGQALANELSKKYGMFVPADLPVSALDDVVRLYLELRDQNQSINWSDPDIWRVLNTAVTTAENYGTQEQADRANAMFGHALVQAAQRMGAPPPPPRLPPPPPPPKLTIWQKLGLASRNPSGASGVAQPTGAPVQTAPNILVVPSHQTPLPAGTVRVNPTVPPAQQTPVVVVPQAMATPQPGTVRVNPTAPPAQQTPVVVVPQAMATPQLGTGRAAPVTSPAQNRPGNAGERERGSSTDNDVKSAAIVLQSSMPPAQQTPVVVMPQALATPQPGAVRVNPTAPPAQQTPVVVVSPGLTTQQAGAVRAAPLVSSGQIRPGDATARERASGADGDVKSAAIFLRNSLPDKKHQNALLELAKTALKESGGSRERAVDLLVNRISSSDAVKSAGVTARRLARWAVTLAAEELANDGRR